jgi:hypothetical protein
MHGMEKVNWQMGLKVLRMPADITEWEEGLLSVSRENGARVGSPEATS